jgi:hypothetical protein
LRVRGTLEAAGPEALRERMVALRAGDGLAPLVAFRAAEGTGAKEETVPVSEDVEEAEAWLVREAG